MNILKLLGGVTAPGGAQTSSITTFCDEVQGFCNVLMFVFLVVVGLAAVGFALYVAFRLAKAEDEGKRKEAKKQLIWSIIAVVSCILIFLVVQFVFTDGNIFTATSYDTATGGSGQDVDKLENVANEVIVIVSTILTALFTAAALVAVAFGVYIGFRLATATDEGKRKEAKQQLLWTIVALVGGIAISAIINQGLAQFAGMF